MKLQFSMNLPDFKTKDVETNTDLKYSEEKEPEILNLVSKKKNPRKCDSDTGNNNMIDIFTFDTELSEIPLKRKEQKSSIQNTQSKKCESQITGVSEATQEPKKHCKKVNNSNFYENLPTEYLEKFPKKVLEPV